MVNWAVLDLSVPSWLACTRSPIQAPAVPVAEVQIARIIHRLTLKQGHLSSLLQVVFMTVSSTLKAVRGLRPADPACHVCVWTEWPPARRSTVSPPVWIRSTYRVNAAQFAQVHAVYKHTSGFISCMFFLVNSLVCYCLGRLCVWRPRVQSRREF